MTGSHQSAALNPDVRLRRIVIAILISVIAASLGFAVCLGALYVADRFVSRLPQYSGLVALEGIYAFPGCLAGWLVFLLPVSLLFDRRRLFRQMIPMCSLGAVCGLLLTVADCRLLFGGWLMTAFAILTPCGVIDAVVATATLVALRQRWARQYSQGA
jgi:hypothetical protein